MYVDQHDFEPLFRETGNYRNEAAFERDLIIMRLIDKLPSLDPFLLRERLRSNDH